MLDWMKVWHWQPFLFSAQELMMQYPNLTMLNCNNVQFSLYQINSCMVFWRVAAVVWPTKSLQRLKRQLLKHCGTDLNLELHTHVSPRAPDSICFHQTRHLNLIYNPSIFTNYISCPELLDSCGTCVGVGEVIFAHFASRAVLIV